MPYIDPKRRDALWNNSTEDSNSNIENSGELSYMLFVFLLDYLAYKGTSYQTFNDISGAMTECLAEFRRRIIVPYEDKKRKQNGSIKNSQQAF